MTTIELGTYANINGQDQWITIRGRDPANPALLIVGGPGGALSVLAPFLEPWEAAFTLIQWDQPGAGSTHAKHGEAGLGEYTVERLAQDAIAVAQFATHYLGRGKLILLGLSGGSIIGLEVALQRPDLLDAYVGSGQIVSWERQMALSYRHLLASARAACDVESVAELECIGPPPWAGIDSDVIASKYSGAPTDAEKSALAGLDPEILSSMESSPPGASYVAEGVRIGNQRPQATKMYGRLRDEIWAFDAWQLSTEFEVPIFFLQGEWDAMTMTSEVERYAKDLTAPHVEVVTIPDASHAGFYQRDVFLDLLTDKVRRYLQPA